MSAGKTFKKKNGMIAQMLIRSDKGSLATNGLRINLGFKKKGRAWKHYT